MTDRFDLRNPPFAYRLFFVAIVWSVCGGFGGQMAALFLGNSENCIIVGADFGAIIGATLEGYWG